MPRTGLTPPGASAPTVPLRHKKVSAGERISASFSRGLDLIRIQQSPWGGTPLRPASRARRQLRLARGETIRLTRVELAKQLPRPRTWLTLAVMVALPILITIVLGLGGVGSTSTQSPIANFVTVARKSGLDMPFAALDAMEPILLVAAVAIFVGEALTGEASWGSLRALLSRPISRSRLLASKALVAALLGIAAAVAVPLFGLASGLIAFGWHPIATPQAITYSQSEALIKVGIATLYTVVSMAGFGSIALFVSTATDSTIGAVATGVGAAMVSQILDALPTLGGIRAILPTHYMFAWGYLFVQPAQYGPMLRGVIVQLGYCIVFDAAAWWWFTRKDILS